MARLTFAAAQLFSTILFFGFSSTGSSAQTVTGTLFGVAYPTELAIFSNDTDPRHERQRPDDVLVPGHFYTEPSGLDTITQNGIFVQDTAGAFFSQAPTAAVIPVVETCSFAGTGNTAVCVFGNNGGPLDFTVSATKTPFFTFIAILPTSTLSSSATASSASVPTQQSASATSATPGSTVSGAQPSATSGTQTPVPAGRKTPIGAIVGAVIGGLVVVGVIGALLLCRRRKQRSALREKVEFDPEPYAGESAVNAVEPYPHPPRQNQYARTPKGAVAAGGSTPTASSPRPRLLGADAVPISLSASAPSLHNIDDTPPLSGSSTSATALPSTVPETRRERRRRLKQMQDTVQQLQRNVSVATPADAAGESEDALQRRQIDLLMGEVERLRAIVARDEALPAYEE
ncbi:hypothetical protein B0H10DRAFT_1977857 [Mycena sp. CBHHK59/15]|nr:hypothetical protein B0H10DRAFT_1977857 [Mycena sp. CBHHK59/15]